MKHVFLVKFYRRISIGSMVVIPIQRQEVEKMTLWVTSFAGTYAALKPSELRCNLLSISLKACFVLFRLKAKVVKNSTSSFKPLHSASFAICFHFEGFRTIIRPPLFLGPKSILMVEIALRSFSNKKIKIVYAWVYEDSNWCQIRKRQFHMVKNDHILAMILFLCSTTPK